VSLDFRDELAKIVRVVTFSMEHDSLIEEQEMDWETLYCPNRRCRYYGLPLGEGRLVKNGSSHGQKQALCKACGTYVSMKYGTAYLDLLRQCHIGATLIL
jgi:hypothetical protein